MSDPHVLVIDDSIVTRRMIARLLGDRGFRTTLAATGEEALGVLERGPLPDAIVCDLHLPGIQGIDVLESVRANQVWGGLPVLVLTGRARGDQMVRAEALADRVMTKPFSSIDLLEAIESMLEAEDGREIS